MEGLEAKLAQWTEYETLRASCLAWLRETDTKLHAVDLRATVAEKQEQLEVLKTLQGEVRAKELEIDAVTERAQQLHKGRGSLVSELGAKYQQVSHKVKVRFESTIIIYRSHLFTPVIGHGGQVYLILITKISSLA